MRGGEGVGAVNYVRKIEGKGKTRRERPGEGK